MEENGKLTVAVEPTMEVDFLVVPYWGGTGPLPGRTFFEPRICTVVVNVDEDSLTYLKPSPNPNS